MTSHFYVPERALVIAAHCDDIEFGAAGTVARWTAAGSQVTYCIVTDSRSGDNNPGTNLERLKRTREEEQRASAATVGVEDVRFLGYQDGILEPTMHLRKHLTQIIREVRPNAVMTFDPETVIPDGRAYINHPDHRATAIAATYAIFPSAGSRPIFPALLQAGYEPHDVDRAYFFLTNHADHTIDITETMEKKRNALRCHPSQFGEDVIDMVTQWNAETGKSIGGGYAEAFRLMMFKEDAPDATDAESSV